jgi:MFS family permease
LSDFWVVAPVIVPFFAGIGLSAMEVFLLESIYSMSAVILNIPGGYFSDVIGRKKTIILSSLLFTLGMALFSFSPTFLFLAIAEVIMGLGSGLKEGSYPALIYDTLIQLKRRFEYKKIEGKATFYLRIGTALSAIFGGLLAAINIRYVLYANAIAFFVLLIFSFSIVEPERKKLVARRSHLNELLRISRFAFFHPKIRYLTLYSALLVASLYVGMWLYQYYYQHLGIGIAYFGVLLAVIGFLSGLGSRYAHLIESKFGKKIAFILPLLSFAIIFLLLGFISSMWMLAVIFFNGFVGGIMIPLISAYTNDLVKSEIRATVISIQEMAGSLLFSIVSPIIGKIADLYSLNIAFISLSVFVVAFGLISLIQLRKNKII